MQSIRSLRTFVEKHLWYVLLSVPPLFIFGKLLTIPVGHFQYEITLSEIVIALMSVVSLLLVLSPHHRRMWRATPLGYAVVLLFLLNIVSVLWVESVEKWLIALRVLTYQYATFFLAANLLKTRRQCVWGLWILFIPAIVFGIYIINTISGIPYTELLKLNRALLITPVGALSFVAAMVACLVPIALGMYHLTTRLAYRMLAGGVYVFLLVTLLNAAGKAAILSVVCGIMCMVVLLKQRRLAVLVLTVTAGIIFFASTLIHTSDTIAVVEAAVVNMPVPTNVAPASSVDVLLHRFSTITSDPSTQFRLIELQTALQIFQSSPIIGQGAGNLKVAYQHYTGFYEGEANNILVQYIAEFGIVGFILFGYVVYQIFRLYVVEYVKRMSDRRYMTAMFTAFLITAGVNAMFEVTIIGLIYGVLFWYVIGIFSAYSRAQS